MSESSTNWGAWCEPINRDSEYERIIAAKDERIAELEEELMKVRFEFDQYKARYSLPSTGVNNE